MTPEKLKLYVLEVLQAAMGNTKKEALARYDYALKDKQMLELVKKLEGVIMRIYENN